MKCKITKYFSKKEISKWLKEEKQTICGVFREIPFSSNKTAKSSRYLLIATVYTDIKRVLQRTIDKGPKALNIHQSLKVARP